MDRILGLLPDARSRRNNISFGLILLSARVLFCVMSSTASANTTWSPTEKPPFPRKVMLIIVETNGTLVHKIQVCISPLDGALAGVRWPNHPIFKYCRSSPRGSRIFGGLKTHRRGEVRYPREEINNFNSLTILAERENVNVVKVVEIEIYVNQWRCWWTWSSSGVFIKAGNPKNGGQRAAGSTSNKVRIIQLVLRPHSRCRCYDDVWLWKRFWILYDMNYTANLVVFILLL